MTAVDEFVADVLPRLTTADRALHNGDPTPRIAMWSTQEPVTLFGAQFTAHGWGAIRPVFEQLARGFARCSSFEYEVVAAGASGDLGYIVGIEHTVASVDGAAPAPYKLRVTTILRREDGEWRVVHRHGDRIPDA